MGNTSLLSSCQNIKEEKQLFDALHHALVNDSTNLYKLQSLYNPPGKAMPDTVVINATVTIKKIYYDNIQYCDVYDPAAFVNNSAEKKYVRGWDRFTISNDALSNSNAKLADYIERNQDYIMMFDYVLYSLIINITDIKLFSPSSEYRSSIDQFNLQVDELEFMPCEYEFINAMEAVLSWVRF